MIRIFPKLPAILLLEKSSIKQSISNDKACRAWLRTAPSKTHVQHALEIETARGANSRPEIESQLIAWLIRQEQSILRERVLKRKNSVKP